MFFTEQLSLLLETGTALHVALQALKKQVENPAMVEVIDGLYEKITEGKSLSYALAQYPDLFPATYINLVSAAEDGGFLDRVLLELMHMDEKRDELRSTVVSALSYPAFLVGFSIFVVIFVLVAVFPKFADMFAGIADKLPATTIFLMKASHLLVNQWKPILAGVVAGIGLLVWWLHTPAGKMLLDGLKLKVYGVRDIFIQIYIIQSLRVLGLSMGNGVSIPDALASCREPIFRTPAVQIVTFYPGMPPEVMERDIMSRLERWTGQSVGIEHQEAKAMLGVCIVKDFFREDISIDTAMSQVTSYAVSDMFYLPCWAVCV